MPFINVKVSGQPLARSQVTKIQADITALMADILHKVGPLVGVLVEEVALSGWSVGAEAVARAAHVEAIISAETNTQEEKRRFIAETSQLLKDVLGPNLTEVAHLVTHGRGGKHADDEGRGAVRCFQRRPQGTAQAEAPEECRLHGEQPGQRIGLPPLP